MEKFIHPKGLCQRQHQKTVFKCRRDQQTGIQCKTRWPFQRKLNSVSCRERYIKDLQNHLYLNLINVSQAEVAQSDYGAVFNLEFSLDGKVLVAACEHHALQFYDPLSMKMIKCVPGAHTDCVNCIKFLDSRTFATGSDDCTIALWDIRNTAQKITELKGHHNWVKSIEYNQEMGKLITSAFDGKVYAWDINSYHEDSLQPEILLDIFQLMRTRLTPDGQKLVLSTSHGYCMIIHDLNLETLQSDFENFECTEYYLLLRDEEQQKLRNNSSNHVFHRKENRVEFVMDYPEESYPWCISSLVIHPQGFCMMSRFTSEMEDAEWTCVHDIQDLQTDRTIVRTQNSKQPFKPQDRLQYYILEPNDGRGYIKELSVSPDGRLICSSFGFGVRLLAFDEYASELCDVTAYQPKELKEVQLLLSHQRTVITSKFSPVHPVLVTACLDGRIVFHQTRL